MHEWPWLGIGFCSAGRACGQAHWMPCAALKRCYHCHMLHPGSPWAPCNTLLHDCHRLRTSQWARMIEGWHAAAGVLLVYPWAGMWRCVAAPSRYYMPQCLAAAVSGISALAAPAWHAYGLHCISSWAVKQMRVRAASYPFNASFNMMHAWAVCMAEAVLQDT